MAKLEKGMKMPDFKVDSVLGTEIVKDIQFSELVGGKPTFFWFQRYIGCPPCRMDVHLLTVAHPEFVEKGANIVVVMQSKPEIVLRDMNGQTLPFHRSGRSLCGLPRLPAAGRFRGSDPDHPDDPPGSAAGLRSHGRRRSGNLHLDGV